MKKVYLVTIVEKTDDGVFVNNIVCATEEIAKAEFGSTVENIIREYEMDETDEFEYTESDNNFFYAYNEWSGDVVEISINEEEIIK